jgi:carbonic anhydrase
VVDKIMDKLIEGNNRYQWKITQEIESVEIKGKLPKYPVLFLTCMDPRIDVHRIFQLNPGDVFILRNAGNVLTEDVLRSILIAINHYEITTIIVLGHMDCGMKKIRISQLKDRLPIETLRRIGRQGTNVMLELQKYFRTFVDEIQNIINQVDRLRNNPEISTTVRVTGMLYDTTTGWVFDYQTIINQDLSERFMRNYNALIQNKKLKLIDFIESIETEIIQGVPASKGMPIRPQYNENATEEGNPIQELKKEDLELPIKSLEGKSLNLDPLKLQELELDLNVLDKIHPFNKPKINIPKIYVPKVKVYMPKTYKKDES